ncbi:ribonuclease H-like protein [Microthyrium microscopicum]|uniref:Ribonuclease H-like protein n=1 Tax=Microthyrium microscopicum TaxID=703497 RepID=A0A6A6U0F4_9PEZI|nr:ribonuclease H-like protein [Microthyrium microscopicum]
MSALKDLSHLKQSHIAFLLKRIGAIVGGKKNEQLRRLNHELVRPRLVLGKDKDGVERARILSVDMGIKNLGYCLTKVNIHPDTKTTKPSFLVATWASGPLFPETNKAEESNEDPFDLYSPSNFSKTALDLVKNVFLPLRPTHILIEKQRFRTGGQPMIQEWTVRVNKLESMLWSILATHNEYNEFKIQTSAVDPARTTKFWVPVDKAVKNEEKVMADTKKLKINLVKSWISKEKLPEEIDLQFGVQAHPMMNFFATGKRFAKGEDTPKKRDDLADCLLQAAAKVIWELNRRQIADMSVKQIELLCKSADAATANSSASTG